MPDLPAKSRRAALEALSRDRLAILTDKLNLSVRDRRAVSAHVDALIDARSLDFGELLRGLSRDDLKRICEAIGLDTSGKEKESIVQRILGASNGSTQKGSTMKGKSGGSPTEFALTAPEPKKRTKATAAPRSTGGEPTGDYRHDDTRKNNPPAGLIDLDKPPQQPKKKYAYDPHLDPQLEWSGKAEHTSFEVDTVSLHIHERISAQAIVRAVKREDAQRSLFGEDNLPESKAIDFYAHDVGWANRLVLGDSLLVMNSLLEREQMAGKVQFIYVDPPYGVKFNSNFQPAISRREVKDGDDASLTREPEQIQAFRDTWTLGIHSYLGYLRDRVLLARDLLSPSGSIFIQIGDQNVHLVRCLMDEIFGAENFIALITFAKTAGATSQYLGSTCDYLVWYGKDRTQLKYRELYVEKTTGGPGMTAYGRVRLPDGKTRTLSAAEKINPALLPPAARIYRIDNLTSQSVGRDKGEGAACWFPIEFEGR